MPQFGRSLLVVLRLVASWYNRCTSACIVQRRSRLCCTGTFRCNFTK